MTTHRNPDPRPLEWNKENLARFWEYHAQFPTRYFSYQSGAAVVAAAKRHLAPGSNVVDYGSGPGHLIPHLLSAGYTAMAADFSPHVTGDTDTRFAHHPKFRGVKTFEALLSSAQKFDAVFMLEVVEHLEDEYLQEALLNASKLVKKGAYLIITTPNNERLEDSIIYCPVSNVTFHRWQHVRNWTASSLSAAVTPFGFEVRSVTARNFPTENDHRSGAFRSKMHRLAEYLRQGRTLFLIARKI